MGGERSTVTINDVARQRWFPVAWLQQFAVGALVGVPLVVRRHAMGAMVAVRTALGRHFAAHEVQLFERAARQVALALGAAQAHETQQTEARIAAALERVGRALIGSLAHATVLQQLCAGSVEALDCDSSHVAMWDADQQAYVVVAG